MIRLKINVEIKELENIKIVLEDVYGIVILFKVKWSEFGILLYKNFNK